MFTNYILNIYNVEDILYIDADVMFFNDVNLIFQSVKEASIGLITHKHTEFGSHVGFFNVGIIYFKNDNVGKQALNWWTKTVATKDTKYNAYAVCGDQKYLELFPSLFDFNRIKILDIDVGHGAPWNVTRGKFTFHDGKTYFVWNAETVFNTKDKRFQMKISKQHFGD